MAPRPASLKVRALQWLAQREHSPTELRGKLLRLMQAKPRRRSSAVPNEHHAIDRADPANGEEGADLAKVVDDASALDLVEIHREVDALLDWLTKQGYLSADRFVESRVHVRQPRYGNLRIQQELRHHGLALDVDARQALKDSELQRAVIVWGKKYAGPAKDATERVRQMRFLSGRGFSPDVIRRVVRAAGARSDGLAADVVQCDAQALDELP